MSGTRTFCFCLPTRLGVLILAPLTFAFALVCSVVAFIGLAKHHESLGLAEKFFLGFLGSMMALTSLASLFGFLGAIFKSYKMVSLYGSSLYITCISILITGAINFGVSWQHRDDFIRDCRADNRDMSRKDCKHVSGMINENVFEAIRLTFSLLLFLLQAFNVGWGVTLAFWLLVMLIGMYLIHIVRQYSRQLQERYYRSSNMVQYHSA